MYGDEECRERYKKIQKLAVYNPSIMGDNIYKLNPDTQELEWQPNNDHPSCCAEHDKGGKNAIICREFYYFGGASGEHLFVPEEFNIRMPKRYTAYTEDALCDDAVTRFVDFVIRNSNKTTLKGNENESNI